MIATHPNGALDQAVWLDLSDPTPEEAQRVRDATGLRVPTKHEVSEIESTSRLGFENGTYYVSTPLLTRVDDGELELAPVGFVVSSRVLVTVRFAAIGAFDDARLTCEKQGQRPRRRRSCASSRPSSIAPPTPSSAPAPTATRSRARPSARGRRRARTCASRSGGSATSRIAPRTSVTSCSAWGASLRS